MRAKPVGSRSDHNCQKTLLIFTSTYSGFVRRSDKHGNFFLCLDQRLAGGEILSARIACPAANGGLADDAEAEQQVEDYERHPSGRRYPHAMAKDHRKLFIGLSLAATSVYSFRAPQRPFANGSLRRLCLGAQIP